MGDPIPETEERCEERSSPQRMDMPREERREELRRRLVQHWHDDARKLLTAAGVPEWVEVGGMPGNSLPHRLEWLLMRRKDVSAAERAGVCDELNAMEKGHIDLSSETALEAEHGS